MKKLSVKRALIGSVMSLLVCIAMFVGTTFAWFTDSAKSTGNKITAGTLDLELSLYNPAASQFENISNSTTPIFSVENWAPGSEELQSATIMIENTGSLDFEVSLDFVSTGDSKLAEVIEVYKSWTNPTVALGAAPATKAELDEALDNHEYAGPVTLEYALTATQYRGIVESGEKIYLGVAMYLPGIVGNEYQGLDAEFDFVVRAKQIKGEFEDLPNEGFRTPVGAIFQPAQYDGKTEVSMTIDNTSVTIPTSAIADTTAPVEVEIKPAVATAGASSVLKVESEDVQVYDIDVTNIKSDAVDPIVINLFVGKGLDESKMAFYHNDELIDFEYDATTGVLSFSSTSFSPFTLLVSDTIAVDSAENLQFAINNGYADITVVGDIENSESFTVADGQEVTVTLLDGVTVAGSGYDGTFYVTNGTLTLNGNGTIVG
ncbi:MAG: hypothetical protein IJY70_03465, partial [Clostridia bacterium]|nr:hypothetical protein [Clostridia bacterium]